MKLRSICLQALLCLIFTNSYAQDDTYVFSQLRSEDYLDQQKSVDPTVREEMKLMEAQIKTFKKKGKREEKVLPIVFHVVRTPDMPQITSELIQSQIDALNRDFSTLVPIEKHPNDPEGKYLKRAAVPQLSFCIPSYDESGSPTEGMTFTSLNTKNEEAFNDVKSTKSSGTAPWDARFYINVWITDLEGIQSGYAQMPGGNPDSDGIVIDYEYFGQRIGDKHPFNQGKTLTHLMGNYLGLYSLWSNVECGDDRVDDTPIHNSPNFGNPEFRHVSLCEGYEVEMTMNFMDATYDEAKYMFTEGQVERMQAVLAEDGPRGELVKTQLDCEEKKPIAGRSTEEEVVTSIKELEIELRPNPAQEHIYLDFKNIGEQDYIIYRVVRLNGEVVKTGELRDLKSTQFMETDTWETGVYLLSFTYDSKIITKKLIIE